MRIWQAVWDLSGKFIIWGESEQKYRSLHSASNLEEQADTLHPFACSADSLAEDLDILEFDPDKSSVAEIILPTTGGQPNPSQSLLGALGSDPNLVSSASPWKVPCLELEPLSTIAFLSSTPSEADLDRMPTGLVFDHSLQVWIESTKFLLDLLAHGRFIPLLTRQGGNYYARWQVVITEENDKDRLKVLSRALPPLCRVPLKNAAEKPTDTEQALVPGQISPTIILESFLSVCGDALIRMFLKSRELTPPGLENKPAFSAINAWLKSLTKMDAELTSSAHELLKLEEKLKHWSGKLLASGVNSRFQTGFRILPPEDVPSDFENAVWTVDILLGSVNDQKTFITAKDFWNGKQGFLRGSNLAREEIEETLLKELGEAHTGFPELSQALEKTCPESVELSTKDAWAFLKETTPLLEKKGYPVILPEWWESAGQRLGLHLEVDSPDGQAGPAAGMLGMGQLIDFSWSVALGDDKISTEDFRKLVDQNANLVFVGNQWLEIDPKKLEATFRFLEQQKSNTKMRLIEALRFGFGVAQGEDTLPVLGFTSSGWVDQLLNSGSNPIVIDRKIRNFKGELRPYQQQGLSWLYFLTQVGIGGCLADDMGLGKTVQFLAMMQLEREICEDAGDEGGRILPTLLVVPMSILENWEREARKFAPALNVYLHHGPTRLMGSALTKEIENSDLVVTTYSLTHRDEEILKTFSWGRIALDEAQNIKNVATKQSKAVRAIVETQLEQVRSDSAPCHRIALTGTPLENHLDELWSIFDFLNPGFLGKLSEFRTRFTLPIERYRDSSAAEALSNLVKPFLLRRLKTQPDILSDLPEKIEMEVFTGLTSEQASLYQKVVDQMLPEVGELDGIHRKGMVLSSLTRLKQICNHPSLYLKDGGVTTGRSGKLNRLEELLEVTLAAGDKTLIFTQYAQMGTILKKHLTERFGQEILFLHGSQQKKTRSQMIDRFQMPDGPKVFILSLKAGGFGLNLTEANQVIHYDQWWNPAVEDQATDRAYRIGQKKNVQVRKFICKGTLEEKISALLHSKKDLADNIVGSARSTITEMSMDELRSLLQLSSKPDGSAKPDRSTKEKAVDNTVSIVPREA